MEQSVPKEPLNSVTLEFNMSSGMILAALKRTIAPLYCQPPRNSPFLGGQMHFGPQLVPDSKPNLVIWKAMMEANWISWITIIGY